MPNPFADLDAEMSDLIGSEFGEQAVISPRIASDFIVSAADPQRLPQTILGVYSSGPVLERLGSVGNKGGWDTRRASESQVFWVSAAQFAALGYDVSPNDHLIIAGRAGSPFRITAILPTDLGDVELHLTK